MLSALEWIINFYHIFHIPDGTTELLEGEVVMLFILG